MEQKIKNVLNSLEKRGIPCLFAENRQAAREEVLKLIAANSTVGIGGSVTIRELELSKSLLDKGCAIFWHWEAKNKQEADYVRRQAIFSDYYLCSANAITEDGRIINIDGTGNRVASMVFGPRKVIIVAGINKIAENFEQAMDRIKQQACPQNARRLNLNTPCAKDTYDGCPDCRSPERMCNVITILEGKPNSVDMQVVIVGEPMGF